MQSDLYAAATAWRKHMAGPTAQPQPSGISGELPEALIPAEPDLDYLRSMAAGDNLPATLRGNILAAVRAIDAAPRSDSKTSVQAQPDAEDAARYRWVRQHWGRIVDTYHGDSGRVESLTIEPAGSPEGWDVDADSLDAAIDAARQGQGDA